MFSVCKLMCCMYLVLATCAIVVACSKIYKGYVVIIIAE